LDWIALQQENPPLLETLSAMFTNTWLPSDLLGTLWEWVHWRVRVILDITRSLETLHIHAISIIWTLLTSSGIWRWALHLLFYTWDYIPHALKILKINILTVGFSSCQCFVYSLSTCEYSMWLLPWLFAMYAWWYCGYGLT